MQAGRVRGAARRGRQQAQQEAQPLAPLGRQRAQRRRAALRAEARPWWVRRSSATRLYTSAKWQTH